MATVGEIIEKLKEYPADTPVVVYGVKGGFDDAGVDSAKVILNAREECRWYGKHEEDIRGNKGGVNCVVIAKE